MCPAVGYFFLENEPFQELPTRAVIPLLALFFKNVLHYELRDGQTRGGWQRISVIFGPVQAGHSKTTEEANLL